MSEVNKKYQDILEDLKKHFKDEKELEYVNKKIAEISSIFLDMMDKMSEEFDERLHQLEEEQVFVSSKLKKIEKIVDDIENDIYDEEFNFDIICPYCNSEFKACVEGESQKQVECPECNNVIELDWNNNCDDDCGCEDCHCEDCDCEDCEDYDCNCDCDDNCGCKD